MKQELKKEEIENMYLNQKLSIKKIGKLLGYTDRTIRNFMIINNIPIQERNNNELDTDTKIKIEILYNNGLNPREISEKINISASKIKSYLLTNNLWIQMTRLEKDELRRMYCIEKLNMRQIALRMNCSVKKVQTALNHFKIKKLSYHFNKIELELLYKKHNISIASIAKMKNTTPYFVKKALSQYNIK